MMKLSKALALKNRLALEVTFLKTRLSDQNSRLATVPFDFNTHEVLAELRTKIDQLVEVKSAIARANAARYPHIFRVAELRGLATHLAALDTKHGAFRDPGAFGVTNAEVPYVAQIRKAEADKIMSEVKAEISRLQDELDDFNSETSIEVQL